LRQDGWLARDGRDEARRGRISSSRNRDPARPDFPARASVRARHRARIPGGAQRGVQPLFLPLRGGAVARREYRFDRLREPARRLRGPEPPHPHPPRRHGVLPAHRASGGTMSARPPRPESAGVGKPATRDKLTAPRIADMKRRGEIIAAVTAYDFPTARLADEAGVDLLLVGDSLGTVVLGYETTLPVTVD